MFLGINKILSKAVVAVATLVIMSGLTTASPLPVASLSGNATLNGYVKDGSNGETMVGATIAILGTNRGAYTNKSGYFSIANISPGDYKVKVSMVGYKAIEKQLTLKISQSLRMDFVLEPASVATKEVNVTAEREVESRQISISTVNVPIAQIKEIRIGGESDVFRSLQMLPGVLTSSQISSGLYIRGGTPDQNLVLLDGATVYNPSHLFGFISTFNSEAIKDVELIKGGYPAEYGSRLATVLNITQKDGNTKEFDGLASLGLISSKLSLEGPVGDGSWFLGGRRTYFDLLKPAIDNDPENPIPDFGFYDMNAKISQNFGMNDKVFLSGFISKDDFTFDDTGFEMNLFMGNKSASARWTHIFFDNFFSNLLVSASGYNNGMKQEFSGFEMKVENSIQDYSMKASTEWFVNDFATLNTGAEINYYIFKYENNFTGDGSETEEGTNEGGRMKLRYEDWNYASYTSLNLNFNDLLSVQAGIRASWWDYSENFTFDPRIAIRYILFDNIAIKGSWGIFHQYLRLAGDENFSLFDTWLPTDKTVEPSKAVHYILSFETKPIQDVEFNLDFYYKDLKNISEVNRNNLEGTTVSDVFYNGKGYSYGMEIFLQRRVGKLAGWLGYGLGWVNAKFDSINGGKEFRPKYDRRHDFKLVLQYQHNERWNFGATFQFQSGQSYTGATSRFQTYMPGDNYGYGKVVPSQRYGLRMPASHQLNLNASYNTTFFDLPMKLILDVYNVYNRRDILTKFYDVTEEDAPLKEIRLLPIIPTFSVELKFL